MPLTTYVAGDVLTAASLNNNFTFAAGNAGVVQVKNVFKDDTFTTSSTSYTDVTGLSVSITPTSASNKILIISNFNFMGQGGTTRGAAQFVRDSTAVGNGVTAGSRVSGIVVGSALGGGTIISNAAMFLDSPGTTSAITYKWQVRANGAGTVFVNRGEEDTDSSSFNRVSSSLSVMEVTP